ncbi:MAG: autotransporter domain-containing protein [Thalassospira sp.]
MALLSGTAVQAADFTVSEGVTDTVAKTLSAGETGLIEEGGVLNVAAGTSISVTGDEVSVTNNGTITSSGTAVSGNVTATNAHFTNNGSISTTGAFANGMFLAGSNGTLVNNGSITASGAAGYGMALGAGAGSNSTLINNGSITTHGNGGHGMVSTMANATLVNHGSITTTDGDGVSSDRADSQITVTEGGTITVSGSGTRGIRSTGANGTITISGSVIVTGAATAAIAGSNNQTLNIMPGATIIGTIDLGGGTNVVNIDTSGGGRSSTLSISNAGTVNTSAGGDGLVLQSGSTVAIVDPTGFAANRAVLGTTTVGIHQAVSQQLARSNKPQSVVVAASELEPGMLYAPQMPFVWGQFFGGYKKRGDDGANLGYRSRVGGAIGGYEKPIGDHSIGVFGGASVAGMKTDEASVESDSNGFFVGGYGEYVVGDWAIDGTMVVGYQRHQDERLAVDNLIGEETAQSDYNSVYISPSLAVIRSIDIGGGIELRPSAEVNYTYGYYGEYTETGTTSSNLRVKGHGVDVINGRLQLAARQALEDGRGEMELRGGMKYSYFGRDSVDVGLSNGPVLQYQGTGDTSSYGGYVGANMRYDVDRRMTVVADMELGLANGDEQSASGYLGLEYRF